MIFSLLSWHKRHLYLKKNKQKTNLFLFCLAFTCTFVVKLNYYIYELYRLGALQLISKAEWKGRWCSDLELIAIKWSPLCFSSQWGRSTLVSVPYCQILSLCACVCLGMCYNVRARTHTHLLRYESHWENEAKERMTAWLDTPKLLPRVRLQTRFSILTSSGKKKKIQKKQNAITRNPGKKGSKTEDDLRLRPDKRVAERWQVTNPTSALSSQRGPDWNSKYTGQPYIPRISVSELKVTIFYRDFAGLYEYFMHLFLPHKPVRSIKI